jgi:hypothetical protein
MGNACRCESSELDDRSYTEVMREKTNAEVKANAELKAIAELCTVLTQIKEELASGSGLGSVDCSTSSPSSTSQHVLHSV